MRKKTSIYPKSSCCIFFIAALIIYKEISTATLINTLYISRFECSRYKKEINETLVRHNLHNKIGLIYHDKKGKKYYLKKGE